MKRWTPQQIEHLNRCSEQSRAGQPVTLNTDLLPAHAKPSSNGLVVTVSKPRSGRQRPDVLSVPLVSESGQPLELHVRMRRRRPSR